MLRKVIAAGLALVLLFSVPAVAAGKQEAAAPPESQQTAIRECYVGDNRLEVPGEMGYFYVDDHYRTQVPLRAISEAMGLTVTWVGAEQKAVIDGGLKGQIVFYVGSSTYTVGGETLTMDTAPVIWAPGRLHVPVRFLVEAAGGSVSLLKYRNAYYLYLYFPKGNVTPTPPSWAVDDYVTFTETTAYQPENWAKILEFRERVEAGENVYFEVRDFCMSKDLGIGVDDGIYYECQLLHTELGRRGFRGQTSEDSWTPNLGASLRDGAVRTEEQELSMYRWTLRRAAAVRTIRSWDWHDLRVNSKPRYPGQAVGDELWVQKLDRQALLAEHWFDCVRNDPIHLYTVAYWTPDTDVGFNSSPAYMDALGDATYYDGRQLARGCGPYQSGDTVMFDLRQLANSLWWEYTKDEVPNGLPVGGTYATGGICLNYYSDDWKREADGSLTISDKGNPQWKPGEILHTIRLQVGSPVAVVDGVEVDLGHPVEQRGWGNPYEAFCVPMSFLTDVLGEQVVYDESQHAWFIGRDLELGDTNLKDWARGMNAMLCMVDGEQDEIRFDPSLLGLFPRGFLDSYGNNAIPGRIYAAYYLYHGWNAMDGESVRAAANALNLSAAASGNSCPAWDAFRVGQLAAWGFTADYISLEEAMSLLYPAAKVIHDSYDSWEEACQDYLRGYEAFVGSNESDFYQLRAEAWSAAKSTGLYDDSLFQTAVIPYSAG